MSAKTILITGSTSGIGLALAQQYGQNNRVIACGRDKTKLKQLEGSVDQTCSFDVTQAEQIAAAAKEIETIDLLILNAGDCQYIDNAKHFDGDVFAKVIATNLSALGSLLQYFLPKVPSGGQVVFISSSATIVPFPRSEAYGASKAGVDYLANSLRLDLVNEGIDVTLIHPGFVKTPLTDKNNFTMPFIISAEKAAIKIIAAIEKRKTYFHFPKRLTFCLKLFSLLPASLWQKLITKRVYS